MDKLNEQYPQYEYTTNQGYGTPGHKQALLKHGVSVEHRLTFKPIKELLPAKLPPELQALMREPEPTLL
jgi:ribonuclease HII